MRFRRKKPKAKHKPSPEKQPIARAAESTENRTPRWLFQALDWAGPFGWDQASRDDVRALVIEHIRSIEAMTWADHGRKGSHAIPVSDISAEARRRLEEIGQADIDEVYSLRFGGKKRIIGVRQGDALKILWWDPEHRVCPSYKKGT